MVPCDLTFDRAELFNEDGLFAVDFGQPAEGFVGIDVGNQLPLFLYEGSQLARDGLPSHLKVLDLAVFKIRLGRIVISRRFFKY